MKNGMEKIISELNIRMPDKTILENQIINDFVTSLFIKENKIVILIDDNSVKSYVDIKKEMINVKNLENNGYTFVRFHVDELKNSFDQVINEILLLCNNMAFKDGKPLS